MRSPSTIALYSSIMSNSGTVGSYLRVTGVLCCYGTGIIPELPLNSWSLPQANSSWHCMWGGQILLVINHDNLYRLCPHHRFAFLRDLCVHRIHPLHQKERKCNRFWSIQAAIEQLLEEKGRSLWVRNVWSYCRNRDDDQCYFGKLIKSEHGKEPYCKYQISGNSHHTLILRQAD